MTQTLHVALGDRSYDVVVGRGLLAQGDAFVALPGGDHAVIVTNEVVQPLYSSALRGALSNRFKRVSELCIPDGEAHKNWSTLNLIFDRLIEERSGRDTTLFALGGGVVGDLCGFAAASFMRGVPYVQVPTTLLAQVDSSVGGKTGINHPAGKNLIGAFHQPRLVVADVRSLKTLPRRELIAGLAEVVKYGAILDSEFFTWIESNLPSLLACDEDAMTEAVLRSCAIKARVVAADELESGPRELLNFGHTFAHAIETAAGYGTWLHGEAVGCGMLMAAAVSHTLGLVDSHDVDRLVDLVRRAGLPQRIPPIGTDRFLALMRMDKKARYGQIRVVLMTGLGAGAVMTVDEKVLTAAVRAFGG